LPFQIATMRVKGTQEMSTRQFQTVSFFMDSARLM